MPADREASRERVLLDTGAFSDGLSPRVFGMVVEWASLHRDELLENWELARQQAPLNKTAPLE